MHPALSRQMLEQTCRVLRKPRKGASARTLASVCNVPVEAMKAILTTLQEQPYIVGVRDDKGAWLSYSFTNYAPRLIHMSFCAVLCEGKVVEGSESPAAPMFDGDTQARLREQYQNLAREKSWVYLDVTHDHMAHLLDALQARLKA